MINVELKSSSVPCCIHTLNPFAASHAVPRWLSDAARVHDVCLRCRGCSSAQDVNSISPLLPTNTEKALTINKNKCSVGEVTILRLSQELNMIAGLTEL